MGVKNFFARVGDLDGPAGALGEHGRGKFERNHFAFSTETAADQGLDDAHSLFRHAERRGKSFLEVGGDLRRGPHHERAVGLEARHRRMRLKCGVRHLGAVEPVLADQVALGEPALDVAKMVVVLLFDVVRPLVVDQIRFRQHRLFRIEISRQDFVVHADQLQSLFGECFGFGGNARNVVSDVADPVHGKDGLVMADGQDAVFHRRVGPGRNSIYTGSGCARVRAGCEESCRPASPEAGCRRHKRPPRLLSRASPPWELARRWERLPP